MPSLIPQIIEKLAKHNNLTSRHVHRYKALNRLLKSLLSAGGEKFVLKN